MNRGGQGGLLGAVGLTVALQACLCGGPEPTVTPTPVTPSVPSTPTPSPTPSAPVTQTPAPSPPSVATRTMDGRWELGPITVDAGATAHRSSAQTFDRIGDRFQLTYGLDKQNHYLPRAHVQDLVHTMELTETGTDYWRYRRLPDGCAKMWPCIFSLMAEEAVPALTPTAERFLGFARTHGLSRVELADLIVSYVQHIEYRIPDREPFGVLPPSLVAAEGWGDCDSKSLLAAVLLKLVGIDAAIFGSDSRKHAILGVDLPGAGARLRVGSTEWLLVESTHVRPMGQIAPEDRAARDWEFRPITLTTGITLPSLPEPTSTPSPSPTPRSTRTTPKKPRKTTPQPQVEKPVVNIVFQRTGLKRSQRFLLSIDGSRRGSGVSRVSISAGTHTFRWTRNRVDISCTVQVPAGGTLVVVDVKSETCRTGG